jgi:hypothetical protein
MDLKEIKCEGVTEFNWLGVSPLSGSCEHDDGAGCHKK